MPITIRELVIRTSIPDVGNQGCEAAKSNKTGDRPGPQVELETLVQMCVRQVMERLSEQHER